MVLFRTSMPLPLLDTLEALRPMPTGMRTTKVTLSLDQGSWLTSTWQRLFVRKWINSCRCLSLMASTGKRIYADILANEIDQPDLINLIQQFLYDQCHSGSGSDTSTGNLPEIHKKISVYTSAVATFYAPSDISGVGGMRCERIHAVDVWRKGPGRYDCVFVNTDPSVDG